MIPSESGILLGLGVPERVVVHLVMVLVVDLLLFLHRLGVLR